MSSAHAAIMISCRLPVRRKHPPLSGCAWRVSFVFVDIPKGRGMQWQDGGRAGLCLGGAAWWWHGDNMLALLLFFFVGSIFSVCFLDCFPFFCIVSLFVSCFLPRLSFSSFLLLLEFRDYCQFFLLVFEDIFADFFFFFATKFFSHPRPFDSLYQGCLAVIIIHALWALLPRLSKG